MRKRMPQRKTHWIGGRPSMPEGATPELMQKLLAAGLTPKQIKERARLAWKKGVPLGEIPISIITKSARPRKPGQ